MTDKDKDRPFEERLAEADGWIQNITDKGVVGEIDPMLLRGVLVEMGADFEPKPELEALSKYTNSGKRSGLNAVWGKGRVDAYKKWVQEVYIPQYEQQVGRELPTLFDPETKTYDDVKYSGMMQFLGELTAYAAGKKTFADYKRLTENRVRKGKRWKEEGIREHSPNAPILPEFPADAWSYIKSGFTSN